MESTAIARSEAHAYWVGIEPVSGTLVGHHHLSIDSQWKTAKNPDELVRKFSAIVGREDLVALHSLIGQYLEQNPAK